MSEQPGSPSSAEDTPKVDAQALRDFVPMPMQADPGQEPESLLGRRIAIARGHYDLTVEALSRLTKLMDSHKGKGISPPSLARYESGETFPGAREIRLLCDVLAVGAQWLIYGDIDSSGKSKEEQMLLSALDAYLEAKKQDINLAGKPLSEHQKWWNSEQRRRFIEQAKKP